MAKAAPRPERSMRTPLPQQSPSSNREEASQWRSVEGRLRRCVAVEGAAKRMLRYPEDSEDLKVGISELREQLETLEEEGHSIIQIAHQARNEKGQKIFDIFRQGEEEVSVASLARWDKQLKGLAELETRCQGMMQEGKLSSERQQVLKGMVEDKIRLKSKATEKYCEKIFEDTRELEEKESKETLLLFQKKHILIRYQSERDKVRKLQRLGASKMIRNGPDTQDTLSFESCMSSVACDMEEVSSESSRKMQDKEETASEVSWTAIAKKKEKDGWRLEPEGETETPEVTFWDEAEGVAVTPEGESLHEQTHVKSTRREREAPGEEGEEIKCPKREVIRVESEETKDYVKES